MVGYGFYAVNEKILAPIFQQKQVVDKEKRSLTRIWKARETHIQNSVEGASLLAGQLETILGASVVNQLGFENFDILEVLEEDDKDA